MEILAVGWLDCSIIPASRFGDASVCFVRLAISALEVEITAVNQQVSGLKVIVVD